MCNVCVRALSLTPGSSVGHRALDVHGDGGEGPDGDGEDEAH